MTDSKEIKKGLIIERPAPDAGYVPTPPPKKDEERGYTPPPPPPPLPPKKK